MKSSTRSKSWRNRPAFSLAEASIGLALALVGSGLVANMVVSGLRHARSLDERLVAQEELANLRERCLAAGDSGRRADWGKSQSLSPMARDLLPQATLTWKREVVRGDAAASDENHLPVRWSVELKWKVMDGGPRVASLSWLTAPYRLPVGGLPPGGGRS